MPKAASQQRSAKWTTVAFGDVVRLCTERSSDPEVDGFERYVGLEHLDPGELRVRRWGDLADGVTFTNVFRPGQVLFGKRRAYQRKVAVVDFSGVCSGDIYVLEPKGDALLSDLLPFICQTDAFFEHAVGTSAGSLSPRTNWESLASYEFAIPPLEEQRRLADVLLAASRAVEMHLATARQAETTRVAAADRMFKDALADSKHEGISLGDVCAQVVDRGHTGLRILSVTIDGEVVRRESLERAVSDETGEEKLLRVLPRDLAYNTMRLWQGAVGVVQEEGLISPAYTVLRLRHPSVAPEYYCELLRSPALRRIYRALVTGVASDRWRLYYRDLCKIRIRQRSPDEAKRVLAVLDGIRHVESEARMRAKNAQRVLEVIVQRGLHQ